MTNSAPIDDYIDVSSLETHLETRYECRSIAEMMRSPTLAKIIEIYNRRERGLRADRKDRPITVDDLLSNKNARSALSNFFETELKLRLNGADSANRILKISARIKRAMEILDMYNRFERNGHDDNRGPENLMLNMQL